MHKAQMLTSPSSSLMNIKKLLMSYHKSPLYTLNLGYAWVLLVPKPSVISTTIWEKFPNNPVIFLHEHRWNGLKWIVSYMHDFCKILSHLRKGFYIENHCVFKEFGLYSATITMQEVCSIMIKSITIYFLCKLQIDCMSNNSFSINFLRLNFREYESRKWGPSGGPGIMFM